LPYRLPFCKLKLADIRYCICRRQSINIVPAIWRWLTLAQVSRPVPERYLASSNKNINQTISYDN
jgi:hypothetical protein